jgi:hypothetical protein
VRYIPADPEGTFGTIARLSRISDHFMRPVLSGRPAQSHVSANFKRLRLIAKGRAATILRNAQPHIRSFMYRSRDKDYTAVCTPAAIIQQALQVRQLIPVIQLFDIQCFSIKAAPIRVIAPGRPTQLGSHVDRTMARQKPHLLHLNAHRLFSASNFTSLATSSHNFSPVQECYQDQGCVQLFHYTKGRC